MDNKDFFNRNTPSDGLAQGDVNEKNDVNINSPEAQGSDEHRSRRSRRRDKRNSGDFSSFGTPMKAESSVSPVQKNGQITFDDAEAVINEEPSEEIFDEEVEKVAEADVADVVFDEASNEISEIKEEIPTDSIEDPEPEVDEVFEEATDISTGDGEAVSEKGIGEADTEETNEEPELTEEPYSGNPSEEIFEAPAIVEDKFADDTENASDTEEEITESEEVVQEFETSETDEEAETEALNEEENVSVSSSGQVRGFGCDEEEPENAEEELTAETQESDAAVSDSYGIQQKFDITFLDDPIVDVEEHIEEKEAEKQPEIVNETAEGIFSDDIRYESELEENEDSDNSTEDTDGDVLEEQTDDGSEAVTGELTEDTEMYSASEKNPEEDAAESNETAEMQDAEASEESNDIWDEDGREEWLAKEKFLEHCRSLTVPPLRTTKTEKPKVQRPPMRSTTSGYQYEEAERLPFDVADNKPADRDKPYSEREKEYCRSRAKEESKRLRDKAGRSVFKIWITAAVALVMLALDCMNFISRGDSPMINGANLTAFCCAQLVLILVCSALAYGILRDGIRCAFKGSHIPETLTFMVVAVSILYHAVLIFIGANEPSPMIIGSPAALAVILAMIYKYYMLRRDIKTFEVAAHYREYATDVKMKDFTSTPEYSEFDGYASSESELYKINRVSRIDGIYETTPVRDTCFGMMRVLSLVAICAAVVAGLAFGFIKQSISEGLFYATLTVAMASPLSVFVAMYLPRIKAADTAAEDGSAIISFNEESEMFEKSVIMLDDSELYKANTLSPKIEVCKTADMETRLHKVASLFHRLGGTLGTLFQDAGFDEYEDATLLEIDAHGIYATVGDSDVIAGSEKYLSRYGIKVNKYDGDVSEDLGVLYIADNGRFFCRIIMTFKPDKDLCRRISELRNTDTLVSLKSSNPFIDENLIFRTTELEPELLRLIKYSSGDDVCPSDTDREGHIVSTNGSAGLFSALLEYKRQRKRIYNGSRFAIGACVIGAVLAVAVILAGESIARFAPLIAVGTHGILSLAAALVASRKAIDTRTVIKKK